MNGNKVEDGQHDVKKDKRIKKGGQVKRKKSGGQASDDSQDDIGGGTSQGDKSGVAFGILEVEGVKLDRFAPAETEENEHDSAQGR